MDYYYLSLAGLSLDIFGTVALFFLRDQGLNPIKYLPIPNQMQGLEIGPMFMVEIKTEINIAVDNLNKNIYKSNEINGRILRKSRKWLLLIIVGFLLQFYSTWLQRQEHLDQANDMQSKKSQPGNTPPPPIILPAPPNHKQP